MRVLRSFFLSGVGRYVGVLLTVGAATLLLLPFRSTLGEQIIALVYLLPVLVCTVLGGLWPGILAGFLSFLSFNYFYIPPLHTFIVNHPRDVITLTMFLIVAVVTSQLIGQAHEGMRLARSREWEATRMYELISALAGAADIPQVARIMAQYTCEAFQCSQAEVWIDEAVTAVPTAAATVGAQAAAAAPAAVTAREPEASRIDEEPRLRTPMMTARGFEGEIRMWMERPLLTREENRLLVTFASQGALAVERIRLSRGVTRARVLEESDRMKTALLSSVSHELRSPLSAIKASVSSLRGEVVEWDSDARHELLTTIEEETDHLNFLVGNLLDMSRIEAGALKPHLRWNSLAEIALGAIQRMRGYLKDYQVVVQIPPAFPLAPVDYVLIDRVFANLLSNSVKFAPPGTKITLAAAKEGDMAHLRVINQGPPVLDEDLGRIFEKFYQPPHAGRATGTGLGLSICKGIISEHGGQIWAENGQGCFIFHFTLPLKMQGELPKEPPQALTGAGETESAGDAGLAQTGEGQV